MTAWDFLHNLTNDWYAWARWLFAYCLGYLLYRGLRLSLYYVAVMFRGWPPQSTASETAISDAVNAT